MADRARFSRSGTTNPRGKCTGRIDVPVPDKTEADFRAVAAVMEKKPAELARQLIEDFLYGRLTNIRMAANGGVDDGTKIP